MSERCALDDGLYWQNASRRSFPAVCQEQCGELMEQAEGGVPTQTDVFDKDCHHDVEYGDTSLQRGNGRSGKRLIGVLSTCIETGDDAFAETYKFTCPND